MANTSKSIDNLVIKITANAGDANTALDTLIRNVTNLGNALNGVDTRTFTDGIKNIGSAVNSVKLGNFQKQMSKMSRSMSDYARNMVKVARNTRTGTSGFNAFNRGITSMQSGLSRINSKINDFASKVKRANKETKNFAQTVGLLYARFFLLIRGAKALIGAVKSSMNYIEVLNYFDASFGQVAERGVDKWSEMGYDSAQAYYDSFAERAKKVTGDMSGFFPEKNGTLTPTGMQSLGMNPTQLMQYQSQFAQMASSMGTTSEQALKLSEVLTKIGADLASVKNMEFEDVWRDMASGLVGMSRTLDKYGANIRNANMEAKLHELGINATVKSLSQADKALLRTIILLDSSKYAWADLAETLNTPANQFRMLANNVKLLGQMIGNIFLPVVAKILPYLNAFVIVLQRLFSWLAKILGIDLSSLMGKNQGYDNSNLSDMLDDAEDLSDALDEDTKSAKKLKKQLQGFDALNNLTTNEDKDKDAGVGGVSGLLNDAFLKAVEDYLDAWKKAFDELDNRAQRLADRIQAFFLRLANPIIEAWNRVGQKVKTQWMNFGYNLKWLFKRIAKDFWRVWEEEETTKIFENILSAIGNVGEALDWIVKRFNEAWASSDNGYRILAGIRDIFLVISDRTKQMSESIKEWAKSLNLKPLLGKMAEFIKSLSPVIDTLLGILKDFLDQVLLPLAKWTLEDGLPKLLQVFIDFNKKVNWEKLKSNLKKLWEHLEPFAERVGEGFIIFLDRVGKAVADFVNSKGFEDFLKKLGEILDKITAEDVANFFEAVAKAIVGLKIALKVFSIVTPITNMILFAKALKMISGSAKGMKNMPLIGKIFGKLGSSIGSFVGNIGKNIGATFGDIFTTIGKFTKEIQSTLYTLGGKGSVGFAGVIEFLKADIGALLSSGSVATIGATIGTALIGGIISAIAGFKFGKWLGEHLFEDDASWYENFKWTGEGGFFDSLNYFVTEMIPEKMNELKTNITVGIGNALISLYEKKSEWVGAWEEFRTSLAIKAVGIIDNIISFKDQLSDNLTEAGINIAIKLMEIKDKFTEWKENVALLFDKEAWADLFGVVQAGAQIAWDNVKKWWNSNITQGIQNAKQKVINFVNDIKKKLSELRFNFSMNTKLEQHGKLPTVRASGRIYANGGFPEDGMFFANHNELVGKFENGKTAVANNEQIVSGIQNGVYGAMSESNALLMEQNSLLQAILEKETGINANDIFKSVQRSASNYSKQYGKPAFN